MRTDWSKFGRETRDRVRTKVHRVPNDIDVSKNIGVKDEEDGEDEDEDEEDKEEDDDAKDKEKAKVTHS